MSTATSWTVNLLVEDLPLRRALERLLRREGYRVTCGEGGPAGVTIISIERDEELGAAGAVLRGGPGRRLVLLAGTETRPPWPKPGVGVRVLPLPCGAAELLSAIGACLAETSGTPLER